MFHFPTFPPHALCVQAQVPGLYSRWVSPFGHPRITGRLSPSRGFSQTPTSFIGSRCQGIHHVHLVACCYYKDARVHCVVLKIRAEPHHTPAPTTSSQRTVAVRLAGGPAEDRQKTPEPSGPNNVPDTPTPMRRLPQAPPQKGKNKVLTTATTAEMPNNR